MKRAMTKEDCLFERALKEGDLSALRRTAKSDLHNHGVFGASREVMRDQFGIEVGEPPSLYQGLADMDAWWRRNAPNDLHGKIGFVRKIRGALIQAQQDGVSFLLLSFGGCLFKHFGDPCVFADFVKESACCYAPNVKVGLEYSLDCRKALQEVVPLAEQAVLSGRFCALDALGIEGGDPAPLRELFLLAKAHGMRTGAHWGEFCDAKGIAGAINVLGLEVVQHGLSIVESESALDAVLGGGVVVNVCPSSNLKLGRVKDLRDHPIRAMVAAGVRLTISSDDPLLFDCSVSGEYQRLYEAGALSAMQLNEIRQFGLKTAQRLLERAA